MSIADTPYVSMVTLPSHLHDSHWDTVELHFDVVKLSQQSLMQSGRDRLNMFPCRGSYWDHSQTLVVPRYRGICWYSILVKSKVLFIVRSLCDTITTAVETVQSPRNDECRMFLIDSWNAQRERRMHGRWPDAAEDV